MNLLQRITAKEIAILENVSIKTGEREIKDLKKHFNICKPRFYHYFRMNNIDYAEYCQMTKQSLIS